MTSPARRTIIIEEPGRLSLAQGRLVVRKADGTKRDVPLHDVRTVMIVSLQTTITAALVNELHGRQIGLILCDAKKLPYGEFVGYYDHHATPARMREQLGWKKDRRKKIWDDIIRQKIKTQRTLLKKWQLKSDWGKWDRYLVSVADGDRSNREGQSARLYFNALFGKKFNRRRQSPINAALNYGYAILCSLVTRTLAAHGFHPSLGIAHRGGMNPLNFSYDLIEPFRPFVDDVVYPRRDRELDKDYKRDLIGATNAPIVYREKKMPLPLAIDIYTLDVARVLTDGAALPKEPGF